MTLHVTLFSKDNCSLCDDAQADLETLQKTIPHELLIVDINKDPALQEAYDERVPVIQTGKYTIEPPFDKQRLQMILGAARDSNEDKEAKQGTKRYRKRQNRNLNVSRSDRTWYWITKKYLLILNILLFLFVGLPFLAPVLMNAGMTSLAKPIYTVYSVTCHQMAFRSWFLFGDQSVYPRAAANVAGLIPYGEATGLDEEDLWEARGFLGNEQIGYKVAFCERDVAIYAAMLVFGLLYAATKQRLPALKWYWWFLIGIGPIGLDGFSQLLSQLNLEIFSFLPYRESTPFLRTLTGSLFGFMTAWFGFPLVKETMEDTEVILATKINRKTQAAD